MRPVSVGASARFEIVPDDVVIRQGTGDHWREFPQAKAKLKSATMNEDVQYSR